MNDLQKVQFEILKIVIDICNRLKIRYYLVCGSALGAVKYGGFIPWDDDIDIGIFREDYDKFIDVVSDYLPNNLFLQNYKTDKAFPLVFSKIRNSDTTYIEKSVSELDINHGVGLDIFPLDGYPGNLAEQKILEFRKKIHAIKMSCVYVANRRGLLRVLMQLFRIFGMHKHTDRRLRIYERLISKYGTDTSAIICNHGNWQGKLEYAPKWHYGEGTWAEFEGLKVRIPENYDAYLTQKYGDWRAELPEEQRFGHHHYEVCDLTRPYTDYVVSLANSKIQIKNLDKLN